MVAESATVLPLGGGESSPLAGGSAKATLKRQPMTMRKAMPHLAWLGMPRALGAGPRPRLWCKNGCGGEEVMGVLDPLRYTCPFCSL